MLSTQKGPLIWETPDNWLRKPTNFFNGESFVAKPMEVNKVSIFRGYTRQLFS